ncbi:MAG: UDP-N-acetylmuramoyl-L-alanine--D-glutamate ligase [Magnetococcales bacterium]|nr:UDP-N-acetylmuramoyl-L-alanine--D-glutamate ligase [Magnetococcales bacterium]
MALDPNSSPIGVVGLGLSGIAACHFLLQRGYRVLAWDQNPQRGAALASHPGLTLSHEFGPNTPLNRCQTILLSPGIPRSHPALEHPLTQGIPVINDVEWLYQHNLRQACFADFIGITGTNGKSTVTTLVGLMLAQSGFQTQTGGNLGQAALSLWGDEVEKYVLELSSFQLESLPSFRPQTATLLNISPDHLDRYADFDDYLATKLQLFAHQQAGDQAVINGDDALVMAAYEKMAGRGVVNLVPFSTQRAVPGGVYLQNRQLIDHRGSKPQPFLGVDQLKITGIHNQANALAAAATALCAGASRQAVIETLSHFPGLAHRMEWIRTVNGIPYYNDSKGTNVGAVIQSLASFDTPLILIAGGRDKNSDFSPLVEPVAKRVSHLILLGEASSALAAVLSGHCRIEQAQSMEQAVLLAHGRARPGETVLLSPACASFDMFKNFEERGDLFRKAVHEL